MHDLTPSDNSYYVGIEISKEDLLEITPQSLKDKIKEDEGDCDEDWFFFCLHLNYRDEIHETLYLSRVTHDVDKKEPFMLGLPIDEDMDISGIVEEAKIAAKELSKTFGYEMKYGDMIFYRIQPDCICCS
jgi:hypothetical protein